MGGSDGIAGLADRKVAVKVAEIAVFGCARIQHQDVPFL